MRRWSTLLALAALALAGCSKSDSSEDYYQAVHPLIPYVTKEHAVAMGKAMCDLFDSSDTPATYMMAVAKTSETASVESARVIVDQAVVNLCPQHKDMLDKVRAVG